MYIKITIKNWLKLTVFIKPAVPVSFPIVHLNSGIRVGGYQWVLRAACVLCSADWEYFVCAVILTHGSRVQ